MSVFGAEPRLNRSHRGTHPNRPNGCQMAQRAAVVRLDGGSHLTVVKADKLAGQRGRTPLIVGAASALALAIALSRGEARSRAATPVSPATPGHEATAAARASLRDEPLWFEGACDASGAVALDARRFAVADDEDNVLRVYDALTGGAPVFAVDLTPGLGLVGKKKRPESDIEAATRVGEQAFFLTSHGRTKSGKLDPDRFLFFATTLPDTPEATRVIGSPHRALIRHLASDPRYHSLALWEAARRPPKAPGGLNLEGLTAAPDGSVWLGFRSPVPAGRALVVGLRNPAALLGGARPEFSAPVLLDLGGLGVRSLSYWRGRYLLLAGPATDGGPFRLYTWDGQHTARSIPVPGLAALHPEAFFTPENHQEIMILSDDGNELVGEKPCKKLKQARAKRFRGLWLRLPLEDGQREPAAAGRAHEP